MASTGYVCRCLPRPSPGAAPGAARGRPEFRRAPRRRASRPGRKPGPRRATRPSSFTASVNGTNVPCWALRNAFCQPSVSPRLARLLSGHRGVGQRQHRVSLDPLAVEGLRRCPWGSGVWASGPGNAADRPLDAQQEARPGGPPHAARSSLRRAPHLNLTEPVDHRRRVRASQRRTVRTGRLCRR